jgi:hypothetical protein
VDDWIMCDACDQSWHKVCEGIDLNARTEDVAWPKCSKCGMKDAEEEMLVKKRKKKCIPLDTEMDLFSTYISLGRKKVQSVSDWIQKNSQ